ncbi:TonB-dependent receptor, partial [bacterium]|nr:TonB-dependent receptor [bacterium]
AVYLYEHRHIGRFHLQGAARFDARTITPDREFTSIVIGRIEERSFAGASGSLSTEWEWRKTHWLGATLTSSWRAPGTEELFSGGPHLAAYSYEIGNPSLDAERGWGSELYLRVRRTRSEGRFAVFYNLFDGYIFPAYTGRRAQQRNDLYEYRYEGQDAVMVGAEAEADLELNRHLYLHGTFSYVRGQLIARDVPLPQMPPLSGSVGVELRAGHYRFDTTLHGAGAQERTYVAEDPGSRPEDPTAAWLRLDLSLHWQRPLHGLLHSAALSVNNLLDTEYRNHLSRVRSVMPEPGRSIKLVYRVFF